MHEVVAMDRILKYSQMNFLWSLFTLVAMMIIAFESKVNGLMRPMDGFNHEVHTETVECPFSTEFVSNVTCYSERINKTSELFALDVFLKPGVQLHSFLVRSILQIFYCLCLCKYFTTNCYF